MDTLDAIILGALDEGCDDALSILQCVGECEDLTIEDVWNRLNSLYNSGYLLRMRKLAEEDDDQPWLTTTFKLTGKGIKALECETEEVSDEADAIACRILECTLEDITPFDELYSMVSEDFDITHDELIGYIIMLINSGSLDFYRPDGYDGPQVTDENMESIEWDVYAFMASEEGKAVYLRGAGHEPL